MKRTLCLLAAFALLFAGCAGQNASTTEATQPETTQPTTQVTEPAVIPDKLIALTFDDGPNSDLMPEFLKVLEQYDAKATFFVIGKMVPANAAVVRSAYQAGHEIGNHSYSHIDLSKLDKDAIQKEIEDCQAAVEQVTGARPAFFRPPFLSVNDVMNQSIDLPYASGYSVGDGTVGSIAADRAYRAIKQAHDGAIILMHCFSGCEETLEALHTIIPELRSQGYEFVTVSELFARKGITPARGIMYRDAT